MKTTLSDFEYFGNQAISGNGNNNTTRTASFLFDSGINHQVLADLLDKKNEFSIINDLINAGVTYRSMLTLHKVTKHGT
jgi:hypothetical protein